MKPEEYYKQHGARAYNRRFSYSLETDDRGALMAIAEREIDGKIYESKVYIDNLSGFDLSVRRDSSLFIRNNDYHAEIERLIRKSFDKQRGRQCH